jgi:hypothetical protein
MMNLLRVPTGTPIRHSVDPLDALFEIATDPPSDTSSSLNLDDSGYEVRFESLFQPGRALSFPCDRSGCVDCDALTHSVKTNYLFARAMVGREFATPVVRWYGCRTH